MVGSEPVKVVRWLDSGDPVPRPRVDPLTGVGSLGDIRRVPLNRPRGSAATMIGARSPQRRARTLMWEDLWEDITVRALGSTKGVFPMR